MDATARIIEVFDRLIAIGREEIVKRPLAKQIVYYVVGSRCEIDINGFSSVYEQYLGPKELKILIEGFEWLSEPGLASEFRLGFELLERDGFYEHMDWGRISPGVQEQIDAIGTRVGDRGWELDEKLAQMLDDRDASPSA
jgi:hypothetical protein